MKISILLFLSYIGFISASLENFALNIGFNMIECEHRRNLHLDVSAIDVYFYDFQNGVVATFPIHEAAQGILSLNNFDKARKIFMFVDGFKSYIRKYTAERMRKAFKNFSNSYLIIIDHSAYTNRPWFKESYEESVKYVYYIGKRLAQLLVDLHERGIPAKSFHCIGNSLGSQILGHVGKKFFVRTGERISRITALDPAGPCFSDSRLQDQIRFGVAEYVEVYHCNAGGFGSPSVLGDVDFFVNDGVTQPNCAVPWMPGLLGNVLAAQCNHRRCIMLWTASVAHPDLFTAYKCDRYEYFESGVFSQNDRTIAGFWNPGNATGVYYFSTEGYQLLR